MHSEKSCSKWTVFKKTVGRFWPVWVTYLVIWVIMLPLNGLMQLQQTEVVNGMTAFEQYARQSVLGFGGNVMGLSMIFGVIAAMAAFSHLYSSRSAGFYGALPFRREWLFSIQYLAGLAFLIIPNLIVFGLTLLVEVAGGGVEMGPLLCWLGIACGDGFFFYSLTVLVAMLVGHILAVPAFFFIVNWLGSGIYSVVQTVLGRLCYGFAQTYWKDNEVVRWMSPMSQLIRVWTETAEVHQPDGSVQWILQTDGMQYVAIYAGVAVLMTAAALLLYRARRMESAGDLVAFKVLHPVFKYSVALCGGLGFGGLTTQILRGGRVVLMLAILFWGVASCFAAQMMLDKSFKVFRKWKGPAVVAGTLFLLLLAVNFDLTGFEKRVPDSDKVSAVQVTGLYSPTGAGEYSEYVDLEIMDQAQIDNVLILHRWALEHRVEGSQTNDEANRLLISLNLTYRLSGGGAMSRSYRLEIDPADMDQEGSAAWALEQIYADRDLYWKAYGFDEIHGILEDNGRLHATYYGNGQDFYEQDAVLLLEAVEEDFRSGSIGRPSLAHLLDGEERSKGRLTFNADRGEEHQQIADRYASMTFMVPDTAVNTLSALDQQGGDLEKNQGNTQEPGLPDTSDPPHEGNASVSPGLIPDNFESTITDNRIEIWIDNPDIFKEDD